MRTKIIAAGILQILFLASMLARPAMAAPAESAYDRVIRTGIVKCGYVMWPPYFDKNLKTGEVIGFSKDLSDAVFKVLGLKGQYIEVVLGEQIQDMRTGKIDAMCGDGPWIISTAKYLDYSTPAYLAPLGLYVRATETRFNKLSDLNKSTVNFGAIDGDLSLDLAQLRFPNAAIKTLPQTADVSELLLNIANGKEDVAIVDPLAVEKFNAHNAQKVKQLFPEKPFAINKAGFSVLKDESKLMSTLNEGLDAARNVGLIDEIIDRFDPQKKLLLRPAKAYNTAP